LRWSNDGVNFTTAMSYVVQQIAWSSIPANFQPGSVFTADLSSVTALNNQATVYFRLVATSAPSATGGTNRVDDFTVIVPEPAAFTLMLLTSIALLSFRRAKRS